MKYCSGVAREVNDPLLGKNWPNTKSYSKMLGFFNVEKKFHSSPKFLATPLKYGILYITINNGNN